MKKDILVVFCSSVFFFFFLRRYNKLPELFFFFFVLFYDRSFDSDSTSKGENYQYYQRWWFLSVIGGTYMFEQEEFIWDSYSLLSLAKCITCDNKNTLLQMEKEIITKVINTISAIKSFFSFYFHIYSHLTLGVADFVSSFQNLKCVININVSFLLTRPFTRRYCTFPGLGELAGQYVLFVRK